MACTRYHHKHTHTRAGETPDGLTHRVRECTPTESRGIAGRESRESVGGLGEPEVRYLTVKYQTIRIFAAGT